MKKINNTLIMIIIAALFALYGVWKPREVPQDGRTLEIEADIALNPVQATFEDLLDAIEQVESGGDANAVGDICEAVGCMQIHPIMVKDVNRILGWECYALDDRYDRGKSRQMCKIYLYHYCKDMSFENMARCWNGGPTGWKKESTKPYWEKVKRVLVNVN